MRLTSKKRFPKGFSTGIACLVLAFVRPIHAENAAFDLIGPKVQVKVQRAGKTLTIAEVPNLQAGDRLWVHPDLPDNQSVHYLMVVVFLRGATNPPPEQWFTRAETWAKAVHEEGVFVTVPDEAEEALVLLAPETGGAFSTLRAAVRGKPGAFVRAAQDLEQASLDRLRLEKYLEAVRETSATDPAQLKARTTLLARSLNIRLDQQCFDEPSAQQAPCLTQHTEQLVLDDAHSQDMVATLMTGAPTDLLAQLSSTPTARSGYYSPYIGAVVDVARILSTAHTAQYQYIPALALPKREQLNLRLNNPPSFRNPKSVLVIGLPPVRPAVLPPLRAVDAARIFCADQPGLELPTDGAPLVFATELAHNFVLHVETKPGAGIDLPAKPDSTRGAFIVETQAMRGVGPDGEFSGTLHGSWGFRPFDGPHFRLHASRSEQWTVASKDASALIVGREDTLRLQSADSSCVSEVAIKNENGKTTPVEWIHTKADELEVKVPLQNASAGTLKLLLKKFGLREPDELSLYTYAEAARLDAFSIHAGDADGLLKGTRLDEVKALELNGITFTPANLSRANQQDELKLTTKEPVVSTKLQAGVPITAQVMLKGLQFFLKTQTPEAFPPAEKVEVATGDESFHALLSIKDGNLTLQDSTTVLAALDPMRLLGPSAFGPLKFRAVSAEGIEGDWQPLVTLVRIPTLKGFRCVSAPERVSASEKGLESESGSESEKAPVREKECTLSGDKLFLIDAVSADPAFTNAVRVPDAFMGTNLTIPPPKEKTLYIKLRDDPAAVSTAVLPILNN